MHYVDASLLCSLCVPVGVILPCRPSETPSGAKSVAAQMELLRERYFLAQPDHVPDLPPLPDNVRPPPPPS